MHALDSIRDTAIIIGRKPFGEADLLLTLFTQKHGKLRVLAKGARRTNSRLVGHAELFSCLSGSINFRSSIPILSQVSIERTVEGLAEDPELLQRISLLAEIIDKATEEGMTLEPLYDALDEGMAQLREQREPMLFIGVLLRLLGLLGFAPELNQCVVCKEKLSPDDAYGWDHSVGGIVTNNCLKLVTTQSQVLHQANVKALRYLQKQPIASMGRLQGSETINRELADLITNYARYVLERPLVSTTIFYTDSAVTG